MKIVILSLSNVLIIGAGGKMGSWFFRYFIYLRDQHENHLKVTKKITKKKYVNLDKIFLVDNKRIDNIDGFKDRQVYFSQHFSDFIKDSNIIVFCTPAEVTIRLLRNLVKTIKPGTTIIEVSSIKNQIHKKLSMYSNNQKYIQFISIHPMFGPGALVNSNSNIILHVPIESSKRLQETKLVKKIFPEFKIIKMANADNHDSLVSIMISLIYFINLVFSKMLIDTTEKYNSKRRKVDLKFLKQISGSSYKVQSMLSESILTDDSSLFAGLFLSSPTSISIIRKYGKMYSELATMLTKPNKKNLENYVTNVKKKVSTQIDLDESYSTLYKFLNKG
jgi:prephenate dehydrogenase